MRRISTIKKAMISIRPLALKICSIAQNNVSNTKTTQKLTLIINKMKARRKRLMPKTWHSHLSRHWGLKSQEKETLIIQKSGDRAVSQAEQLQGHRVVLPYEYDPLTAASSFGLASANSWWWKDPAWMLNLSSRAPVMVFPASLWVPLVISLRFPPRIWLVFPVWLLSWVWSPWWWSSWWWSWPWCCVGPSSLAAEPSPNRTASTTWRKSTWSSDLSPLT